jgi:hypothetical protein
MQLPMKVVYQVGGIESIAIPGVAAAEVSIKISSQPSAIPAKYPNLRF